MADKIFKKILIIISIIILSSTSYSQSCKQKQSNEALTTSINATLQKNKFPGVIVGIWQKGKPIYVHTFGLSDIRAQKPMVANLYTRIGSLTKTFTVTAILQLVDKGKIHLDDPIDKFVHGVPNGKIITLRHLASMRSGLYSYTNIVIPKLAMYPKRQWTTKELLKISFKHNPLFEPGTQFDYSNTNTILLGLVVEKISGQSLDNYIEQHILKPTNLIHTIFPNNSTIPFPYLHGYIEVNHNKKMVDVSHWNPSWGWGAGAMISTLEDIQKWTRILAIGKLLKSSTQKQREHFSLAPQEGKGAMYGLGLEKDNGWIGHNGNITGYLTFAFYLPSKELTLVVILNSNNNVIGSIDVMKAITKIISPKNIWPDPPVI